MATALVVTTLAAAFGDWVAKLRSARRAEYVLKPLTLALLIAAAFALRGGEPFERWALVVAALALSLAGDVFLMVPQDLFVLGLGSFLLAHVAYIWAFNLTAPPPLLTIGAAVVVGTTAIPLYRRMLRGMRTTRQADMALPVALYVVAIGAMVVSAVATAGRPDWDPGAAALAITGGVLFMVSDGLIGWTRFVGPVRGSQVAIIATYHVAQVALVLALLG